MFLLLKKLTLIHAGHYGYEPSVSDEDMIAFLESALGRVGARTLLTPREIIRDYLDALDLLRQNPGVKFKDVIGTTMEKEPLSSKDDVDDFLMGFEI